MRKERTGLQEKKKLPVGVEGFEKIRTEGFYYVDKTGIIKELLNNWGEVNLFTRPRRFGKSLNMNMMKTFFSYGCDSSLFEGLQIAEEKKLCEKYMGKFPVLSITLKDMDARDFEGAKAALCTIVGREALRFSFLSGSKGLTKEERARYAQLVKNDATGRQVFSIADEVLKDALRTLTELLCKHYGQKVVLLIDEYDVPLQKAHHFGYYDEMIDLLGSFLGRGLKSNESIFFSVLTGCLRIAKESIFTGLNNFKIYSISDVRFDEYFGFTEEEVRAMLDYYGLGKYEPVVREWYDGYLMGNTNVYCPWDVINYVDLLRADPDAAPKAFWINTSGNDIIRTFLCMAKQSTKREIEQLIQGESVAKKVREELTYRELYENLDNLWSVLFTTGYLTRRGKAEGDVFFLSIPNLEIRRIFIEQIQEWFRDEVERDAPELDAFCEAFVRGDAKAIEKQFGAYLHKTISIRDTAVRKDKKENFYHGVLLGLLSHRGDWDVVSNGESGDGYSDILVEIEEKSIGMVIELKYSESDNMEAASQEALEQIENMEYEARLLEDGMETIFHYGIACRKKKCCVAVASKNV